MRKAIAALAGGVLLVLAVVAIAGSMAPRTVSSQAVWHCRSVAPATAASISRSAMPRPRAIGRTFIRFTSALPSGWTRIGSQRAVLLRETSDPGRPRPAVQRGEPTPVAVSPVERQR